MVNHTSPWYDIMCQHNVTRIIMLKPCYMYIPRNPALVKKGKKNGCVVLVAVILLQ